MEALNELLAAGRVREASERATQRLTRDPGDVEALVLLAKVALVEGRTAQAEQWLKQAAAKGASREVLLVRAALACQRQDWAEARGLYEQLLRQPQPPAEAWYGLGTARIALGDLSGAREALERAVELKPEQASFRFELGRALALTEQVRPALRQFVLGLRLEPGDARGYLVVAGLMAQRGKELQGRRVLELGLRLVPEAGMLREALEALSASDASPGGGEHESLFRQAATLLRNSRNREALAMLREASDKGLRSAALKMLEASACEALLPSDVSGAIRAYEEAIALDSEDWTASNNLGLFLLRQGQRHVPRAIEVLQESRRRAPRRPEPALNLALAYVKAGRNTDGAELARQLEADLPLEHPLYGQARSLVEMLRTA
jgi:Flp pilus assembly protein TadD